MLFPKQHGKIKLLLLYSVYTKKVLLSFYTVHLGFTDHDQRFGSLGWGYSPAQIHLPARPFPRPASISIVIN